MLVPDAFPCEAMSVSLPESPPPVPVTSRSAPTMWTVFFCSCSVPFSSTVLLFSSVPLSRVTEEPPDAVIFERSFLSVVRTSTVFPSAVPPEEETTDRVPPPVTPRMAPDILT